MGTIEDDEIKEANDPGIVVAVMREVKFPEADAMIAEAIDPVGVTVMLPAAIAELKEFKALEMAPVGTMVLLAKAELIEAIWADIEAMPADKLSISAGIEVAVEAFVVVEVVEVGEAMDETLEVEAADSDAVVEVADDWMALERLDTELELKLELILALALEIFEETLARAAESEVGLIGVVPVAITEEMLAS